MRKALFCLLVVSLFLSGCVTNRWRSTYVAHSYLAKNYYPEMKAKKDEVKGNRNIKFFVVVKDNREDKAAYQKRLGSALGLGFIKVAKVDFKNPVQEMRFTVEKALKDTGWGVADNRSKANMIISVNVREMLLGRGILTGRIHIAYNTKVKNSVGAIVYANKFKDSFAGPITMVDFTYRFRMAAGIVLTRFYKCLTKEFSSNKFVKAIDQAYGEEIFSKR